MVAVDLAAFGSVTIPSVTGLITGVSVSRS